MSDNRNHMSNHPTSAALLSNPRPFVPPSRVEHHRTYTDQLRVHEMPASPCIDLAGMPCLKSASNTGSPSTIGKLRLKGREKGRLKMRFERH